MDASSDDTVVKVLVDAPPADATPADAAPAETAPAETPAASAPSEPQTPELDAPASTSAETPAPRRKPRRTSSAKRRSRTTVTFYLTESLRNRARATYRATSWGEHDNSWSEMLTKALLAEVERRELEHNGGRPFVASDEPLTPGRPIGF